MPVNQDRLADQMKKLGISQSGLAKMIGVSQPTVNAIINGGTRQSKYLRQIALALDTTEAWLLDETDDPSENALRSGDHEVLAEKLGLALIPELDVGFHMGPGTYLEVFEQTGFRAFDREWLRSVSEGNVEKLFVARGDGDSMEPTLHDGDIMLIDAAQTRINKAERIWAVAYGGLGMVKRVRPLPGGRYSLLSDNSNVPPIVAEADDFHVIGRVIWIGRKI